jgi:hypothetical protein
MRNLHPSPPLNALRQILVTGHDLDAAKCMGTPPVIDLIHLI